MYKYKLENTAVSSETGKRLQTTLIAYHNFRNELINHPLKPQVSILESWQSRRLKFSHRELHENPIYRTGLDFLLEELYAPKDFTKRDDDIDRVFPVMVKMLPEGLLHTVCSLVELNMVTQQLDLALTEAIFVTQKASDITEEVYAEGYRLCNNRKQRLHQIQLIANIGDDLDRYVHSKFINFTLKMTRKPAEMAGVDALHRFLFEGFKAFKSMDRVDLMLEKIIATETRLLERVFDGQTRPFGLPDDL